MSHPFLSNDPFALQAALNDANRNLQEEAAVAQSRLLHLPYINLHTFPVDLQALATFSKDEAVQAESIVFYMEGKDVRVGTHNPKNQLLQEKLKTLSKKLHPTVYLISEASLRQAIQFYSKIAAPHKDTDETIRIVKEVDAFAWLQSVKEESAQTALSAGDLLAGFFGGAMHLGASDIHAEPEERFIKLRFRIDGVLQDMLHVSKSLQSSLVSRIKILSKLKLNVDNIPQDGRLTFFYLGKPIDVRVSTLPSIYGEGIVMRLLGTGAIALRLPDLGFAGKAYEVIRSELSKPNGMIITTGPTGSGKTTTLYAFVNQLNEPGVKIITLEDPVEYKLEGVNQTPIDHTVNFDFATGLRAILRQDPDIVLVGEIRDQETAETALQAALTGHVVLSTLHTNDASGAIPRLYTMGVKPFIIGPALNAIIAQRLVRKLCTQCIQPAKISPAVLEKVKMHLTAIPQSAEVELPKELQFYHSTGCGACHNLGYKGRIGIYEVIQMTDPMRELVQKEATITEIKNQAIKQGMVSMVQDGLLKALQKITDIEEVFRVAGE
jgi:type II secretory ATPase GspE/PulE/Tfp pilus assembly ATPase PilB-like protein